MRLIKNANDLGIQRLLRVAKHDDILVLLKIAESDKITLNKFYGNMTETLKKMIAEDLDFQFSNDVPGAAIKEAINRLAKIAKDLEDEGTLIYGNVTTRQVTHGAEED
jgi:flagellar motor switch protein FliG